MTFPFRIVNESGLDRPPLPRSLRAAVRQIFEDHTVDVSGITVILLTDEGLLQMNRDFLQHDYYTDIITFNVAGEDEAVEGELYISLERVRENASTFAVSFRDELARVILHGCLHLAGYEDETETARKRMQQLENKYLKLVSST